MERHVWTAAYKCSENDFFPVVDLASQTVGDLERVLMRSYRLNNLWVNPSAKAVYTNVWSFDDSAASAVGYGGIGYRMEFVEIYQGRYLVLRNYKIIVVCDLQTKREVFRYNAPKDALFEFLRLDIDRNKIVNTNTLDFFLLFWTSNSKRMLSVRISRLGAVSVIDLQVLKAEDVFHLSGSEFAILPDFTIGSLRAVHLPSQTVYPVQSGFVIDYSISLNPIFLPGGYVLMHFVFVDQPFDNHFELYRLSCHTAGTPFLPTHRGCFRCSDVADVTLLSSNITLNDSEMTGCILLFMHLAGGLQRQLQYVTLHLDGSLTCSEVSYPDSLLNLQLTMHPGGKSCGVAWKCSEEKSGEKGHWVLCHVSIDSGEPFIFTGAQLNMNRIKMSLVDVSQGYLVTKGVGGEMKIVDLVS